MRLSLALVLLLLIGSLVRADAAAAQEVGTCQTANGPRTTAQITAELQQAGYGGPWDSAAQEAAYARASGGPVSCAASPSTPGGPASVVVLVAGYGSDLAVASQQFAPLQAALLARDARTTFVFFSYVGSQVQGCASTPARYSSMDTAQSLVSSEKLMRTLLDTLAASCNARIAIVGHSLGGLVAFRTVSDAPSNRVSDLLAVSSPLGGAPLATSNLCIDVGLCAPGPVVDELGQLFAASPQTATDNAARDSRIRATGTRVSAWGNDSDCLYYVSLCTSFDAISGVDARQTQWLGVSRAIHRNYAFAPHLWNIPASHTAVLENAAADLAADILP